MPLFGQALPALVKRFSLGLCGQNIQSTTGEENDIECYRYGFPLPESLPHYSLYPIARHRSTNAFFGNDKAYSAKGQTIGLCQQKEVFVRNTNDGIVKNNFEFRTGQESLVATKASPTHRESPTSR